MEREAAGRGIFLDEACAGDQELRAEVDRLMAARDAAGVLDSAPVARHEGRRIDQYDVLREIGHGGMSTVYLAARADDVYRKRVALKVLRAEVASDGVVERFRQEREILASLDDPNIARLLDGGTTPEGLPYFVMDFIEGAPIDQWCDSRRLDIGGRLRLIEQVCAAVDYAHSKGVVHRDLKPGNILVTETGVVKLVDFGIAKLVRTGPDLPTVALTRTGLHLMTPEYASPEQVRGEAITPATDVYALGVILFELLTGSRPYRMKSRLFHEIVRVICDEDPMRPSVAASEMDAAQCRTRDTSPAELKRQVGGDLERILMQSLSKEPAERYRSAEALRADIERHLTGAPVRARGASKAAWMFGWAARQMPWLVAVLVLAGAVAAGAVRVEMRALWFVMAGAAAFGVWFAATNKRVGRRIAESGAYPLVAVGALLGLVVALSMVPRMSPVRPWITSGLLGVASVAVAWQSAGWYARKRWCGKLLLAIERPRNLALAATMAFCSLGMIVDVFRAEKPTLQLAVSAVFYVLWAAQIVFLEGKLEIREAGILHASGLTRWENIESYVWDKPEWHQLPWWSQLRFATRYSAFGLPDVGPAWAAEILKIYVRRRVHLIPPKRFKIPAPERARVEEILSRYLSAWPGLYSGCQPTEKRES